MKGSITPHNKSPFLRPREKTWLALISLFFYLVWFPYLFKTFGRAGIAFYVLPAILTAYLLGRIWGLLAGLLFGPLHVLLFSWLKVSILPPAEEYFSYYIFISLYLISVLGAYLVGSLQEARLRYQLALKNRQQVSAALRQSEKRYRQLLNHSSNIIVLFDYFGRIEYITPSAESLSGYSPKDLIGKHFAEIIHPDWRTKISLHYARQIKSKTPKTHKEFPILTKDGREIWISNVVELLFDQGQVSGGQGVLVDITSRVEAQQALAKSEERLRSITVHSSDITMIVDQERTIRYISPSIINITEFEPDMVLNSRFDNFIHPDQLKEMISFFNEVLECPPGTILKSGPVKGLHRDGRFLYFECTLTNMMHVASVNGIMVNVREITQQLEMEKELWQSEYSFQTLFNQANDAVLILSLDGQVLEVNQRAAELFGYEPNSLINLQFQDLLVEMETLRFEQVWQKLKQAGYLPISEWAMNHKNGFPLQVEINFGLICDSQKEPTRTICTIRDISERKKTEEILRHLATHDPLTKLPNRELFLSRFEAACDHAQEGNYSLAVAFIDLDEFKNVNDQYGHATGDEVLVEISARLKNSVRQHDTVARMSGDEFTIMLEGVEKVEDVERVIQKISQMMDQPFFANGNTFHVGASIGISMYPQDAQLTEKIIQFADIAMYEAKNQNRPYFFYQNSLGTGSV